MNNAAKPALTETHAAALAAMAADPEYVRNHVSPKAEPSAKTQELLAALHTPEIPDWML